MLGLLVFFIVVLLGGATGFNIYKKLLIILRKKRYWRLLAVFFIFIFKVRTTSLALLIRRILNLIPMWHAINYNKLHNKKNYDKKEDDIDKQEALRILDLPVGSSRLEIEAAFKKLMIKNHPDHGGSKYFTEKIIQARNILIPKGDKK